MQNKDLHRFNIGLNSDDGPADLQPGEYCDALNVRVASSDEQQGIGVMETLQGEVEVIINVSSQYYGGAIGGEFIYAGYPEVLIGNQVWMEKNWDANYPGSKAYGNNEINRVIYGGLYTWEMIKASDFCPDGWHIPSEAEVDTLLTYLGGEAIAGGKMKYLGTDQWHTPNTGADNSSGFKGLPAGMYDIAFDLLGFMLKFWIDQEVDVPGGGTGEWLYVTSGLIWYRKGIRDGKYVIDKSIDGGLTWELDLVQIEIAEVTIIKDIDLGMAGYRHLVRDGAYVIDMELDGTGFAGIEGVNWINVFSTDTL